MGMQCQCPQCGVAFIIPTIASAAPASSSSSGATLELAPIEEDRVPPSVEEIEVEPNGLDAFGSGGIEVGDLGGPTIEIGDVIDEAGETLLHIPCPNGHILDVPREMIGARALCPHCQTEFRLRHEKSIEYLREQELIDAKRAKFWFNLAIVAAGVVGVVLAVMIVAIAST